VLLLIGTLHYDWHITLNVVMVTVPVNGSYRIYRLVKYFYFKKLNDFEFWK